MANVLGNIIKKGKAGVELFVNGIKNTTAKKVNIRDGGYEEITSYASSNTLTLDSDYEFFLKKYGQIIVFKNYLFRTRIINMNSSTGKAQQCELIPLPENFGIKDIINALDKSWRQSAYIVEVPNSNAVFTHFIVWKDDLYALGGVSTASTSSSWNTFRRLNTSSKTWTVLSNIPLYFSTGIEFVTDNALHVIQGTSHYAWNGSSWTQKVSPPFSISNSYEDAYKGKNWRAFEQRRNLYSGSDVVCIVNNSDASADNWLYYYESYGQFNKHSAQTDKIYSGSLRRRQNFGTPSMKIYDNSRYATDIAYNKIYYRVSLYGRYICCVQLRASSYDTDNYDEMFDFTRGEYGYGFLIGFNNSIYFVGVEREHKYWAGKKVFSEIDAKYE